MASETTQPDGAGGADGSPTPGPPPDATQVARRLLVLRFQAVLALTAPGGQVMQGLALQWSEAQKAEFDDEWRRSTDGMLEAFEGTGWKDEMTEDERAFIDGTPLGWEPQRVIDASWRVESVACLLWALRLVEDLPPFDAPAGQEILRHVPTKDAADFVKRAELLPPERIGRKREEAELWHWRSRTRQLEEMGLQPDVPGFDTFDAVVRFVAADLERKGILPETIDGDFAARGKAFRDLAASEWAEARSIILERHRGLNWLCGHAPENRWDQTPTDA